MMHACGQAERGRRASVYPGFHLLLQDLTAPYCLPSPQAARPHQVPWAHCHRGGLCGRHRLRNVLSTHTSPGNPAVPACPPTHPPHSPHEAVALAGSGSAGLRAWRKGRDFLLPVAAAVVMKAGLPGQATEVLWRPRGWDQGGGTSCAVREARDGRRAWGALFGANLHTFAYVFTSLPYDLCERAWTCALHGPTLWASPAFLVLDVP